MGLLGCPASFQRLMEQVLRGLQNILIYIDDELIHTDTHEKHLEALEQVLLRLHQHHLKINLDKCLFGDQQVSYLGFTLTPEGIKPGDAKLKSIQKADPPNDVKEIRSFMGLCNFFQNHIPDFATTAAPLFKLTRQDSRYLSGQLPTTALQAFKTLQTQLSKQPALAFPRTDQNYLLIMKAYTLDQDFPGGLCATLAQKNENGKIQIISHASRQLKDNEKNYTKFLLETAAAAWVMNNFNEYLNGSKFILYKDTITQTGLGTTQVKTLNRLKTTMSEHEFEIRDKQKSDLPEFLKKGQNHTTQVRASQPITFNKTVHVDTICTNTKPENTIITITDDSSTFSISAIITDSSITSTVNALWDYWFKPYGYPEMISFKQGKVQTSRLEKIINDLAPLKQKVTCKSRSDIFNTEVEQQWQQNQHEISEDEFVHTINFLHGLQEPETKEPLSNTNGGFNEITEDTSETDDDSDNKDDTERFKPLSHLCNERPIQLARRKSLSLCRHKRQRRIGGRSRRGRQQHKRNWLLDSKSEQQLETNLLADDTDPEWAQLREMEEFLRLQRVELLQQGIPESDSEDWESPHWPTREEDVTDEEEDDGLEDVDLAFITSILESFSRPKPVMKPNKSFRTNFPPEGTQTQANTKLMTPPKFNHNLTIKTEKFNYFPTLEEEGTVEFTDTEDNQSEIHTEEVEFENHLQGICSITEDVFQNLPAQPWWSVSSPQEYSPLEPTLTIISSISCLMSKEAIKPGPPQEKQKQTNHQMKQIPPCTGILYKPTTKLYRHSWSKRWPELNRNVKKNKDLAEQISRSPRAIKTIQALEAAIAIFGQNKPEPEYEVSKYATGSRHWKRSPAQHPVPIQDLLLYDVQNKHQQNKSLGDKVAQVVRQNTQLAQQISSAYETPSEKHKKDPIMGLVTKTVATYMFPRQSNNQKAEDFPSWGEPFFKKKE